MTEEVKKIEEIIQEETKKCSECKTDLETSNPESDVSDVLLSCQNKSCSQYDVLKW